MGGVGVSLAEKISGLISRDKFENEFRNALKSHGLYISSKENDNLFNISNGSVTFKMDVSDPRRCFERTGAVPPDLDKLIKRMALDAIIKERMVSFTNGQEFLRLLIMRDQDVTDEMISADFVDGLKKTVVYTPDDETIHFLDENALKRWGVPREVVFSVADRNLCRMLSRVEIGEETLGDIKALDFKINSPAFCSSLILCNEFRSTVYEKLGAKFLVVAPSRESLLVLKNITNDILEGLGTVILSEYRKAKNPLTTDVLLFTPQGVQTAGRFSLGHTDKGDN